MTETPIADYLDQLLYRTRADVRTTRRLLDEAGDHLYAAAAELAANGMQRQEAEAEAVRRFGPIAPIARATLRRSVAALAFETARAALFLAGCGLAAVGISGLVALVMNVSFGRAFVGGVSVFPFHSASVHSASVNETADDAVSLRLIAGLIGLLVLLGYLASRRYMSRRDVSGRLAHATPLLPAGLVDALGAAAFAAGTAGLAIAALDQAIQNGSRGVGFPLSGALVALAATIFFCIRTARALLPVNGALA